MIPGGQEILVMIVIVVVLQFTGLWPIVIRGLRELRGDHVETPPPPRRPASTSDLDMCYRLMGLSASAPWEDIERAYRKKAKVHHPDHGGDEDAMRALNEAYERIKRARKR